MKKLEMNIVNYYIFFHHYTNGLIYSNLFINANTYIHIYIYTHCGGQKLRNAVKI